MRNIFQIIMSGDEIVETKLIYELSKDQKNDFKLMGVNHFTNMESKLSVTPYLLAIMGHINILATPGL